MTRIRVLDDALANQIAAGEVVERPASVVKELVENALDAGATAITVDIAGGGIELVRVVDNGHGISAADAPLAVERHATSKIAQAADLGHINTLGFRGEALASIASVSRFSLRTRPVDAIGAVCVRVDGGRELRTESAAGPIGTEIAVRDLFYNVPARRKFLKKPETEAAHAQEIVTRLALAHADVAFRLVKEGRRALDLPRHDALLDRVRALFGTAVSTRVAPVKVDGAFAVDGFVGAPADARATARHYHLFINGRYVRDRVVIGAVQAAYRDALPSRRHPFVVLRLTVPPEVVDVNVHPAKTEVRFVDSGQIHRLIARAVGDVIRSDPWSAPTETNGASVEAPVTRSYTLIAPASPVSSDDSPIATPGVDAHRRRVFDVMERLSARRATLGSVADRRAPPQPAHNVPPTLAMASPTAGLVNQPPPLELSLPAVGSASHAISAPPAPEQPSHWRPPVDPTGPLPTSNRPRLPTTMLPGDSLPDFNALRWLGRVGDGLALFAAADALVVIDVEAALVRCAWASLAAPAPIRRSPADTLTLPDNALVALERLHEAFAALGFELEPFGGRTVALKSAPDGLERADPDLMIRDLLEAESAEALRVSCARWIAGCADELTDAELERRVVELSAEVTPVDGLSPYYTLVPLAELAPRRDRSAS